MHVLVWTGSVLVGTDRAPGCIFGKSRSCFAYFILLEQARAARSQKPEEAAGPSHQEAA
jgi:hypothetical protein